MIRKTKQREAIRDVIREAGRPVGPEEILSLAREKVPGLGLATVYRAVKGLTEEGWLQTVELPGEPPRYERSGIGHHHHFHCRECGRVYDVQGCPGNLQALAPPGFRLEDHEVILYGLCSDC